MIDSLTGLGASRNDQATEALVDREIVRLLYTGSRTGIAATALNSTVVAALIWSPAGSGRILAWLGILWTLTLLRLGHTRGRQRALDTGSATAARLIRELALGLFAIGVAWGAAPFILPTATAPHEEIVIVMALAGMVAGSLVSFSAAPIAHFAFTLPAILPMTVAFLLRGDGPHLAMGAMALIFLALSSIAARRLAQAVRGSFRLGFENARLFESSEAERRATERLADELVRAGQANDLARRARDEVATRLRVVLESLPIVLFACDEEGTVTVMEGKGVLLAGV